MTTINEPAWLTAAVDQRLALVAEHIDLTEDVDKIVMTPLVDPTEGDQAAMDRWERTCDRCGVYCAPAEAFFSGTTTRLLAKVQVVFTFGACRRCKEAP